MRAWIKLFHRIEDSLLVGLLTAMILLAGLQILLRNFFDAGLLWIDPLLRILVLWLGLLGAAVATRSDRHIRIDLLSRRLGVKTERWLSAGVDQLSGWTCLAVAWFSLGWVRLDYIDGLTAFAAVPAWLVEAIVPAAFALMGLRFVLRPLVAAIGGPESADAEGDA